MKKFLLVFLLLCSSAFAQVIGEEHTRNNQGQPFMRIYNTTEAYLSCYYKDEVNYFTFVVGPHDVTPWYPVYGQYEWSCK